MGQGAAVGCVKRTAKSSFAFHAPCTLAPDHLSPVH